MSQPNQDPRWLQWAQQIHAIAQNGLTYGRDVFDGERYQQLMDLAAEIYATGGDAPLDQVRAVLDAQVGYVTPQVDERAALFDGDRVLLVQEHTDGRWALPGGWADPGNTPSENIEREVREETGYLARAVKLALVHDRSRHGHHPPRPFYVYKLFFLCELLGGERQTSIETDDVAWFALDDLPELSIGRVVPEQIALLYQHHLHPDLPTAFD